jgi:hypothetical protein
MGERREHDHHLSLDGGVLEKAQMTAEVPGTNQYGAYPDQDVRI